MPASSCEIPPIRVHLPSTDAVMGDIPLEPSTSPSSLAADDGPLTQTIHYTHDGTSITFEIVNKRTSLTELDSDIEEVDPIPGNIFTRVLNAICCSCTSFKTRRVKAKSITTFGTA